MDVFPTQHSTSLVPVAHPGKWDPFETLMHQGRVEAFVSFMDPSTQRIFHHRVKDWTCNTLQVDNFKRAILESKKVNFFDPKLRWCKVAKKLKTNPTQVKKNTDQRLNFKFDNMLIVKQLFSFGFWKVTPGEGHVFQTSDAPMLIYHLPEKSFKCKPGPVTMRRSFVEQDQFMYDRYVLRPNGVYVVPPGTNYLILTVQKTLFAVDVMRWKDVDGLMDFQTHKHYSLTEYVLPPPTPAHEMETPKMVMPEERRRAKRARRDNFVTPAPRLVAEIQEAPEPQPQNMTEPQFFPEQQFVPHPQFVQETEHQPQFPSEHQFAPEPQLQFVPEQQIQFAQPQFISEPRPQLISEPQPQTQETDRIFIFEELLDTQMTQDVFHEFLAEFERELAGPAQPPLDKQGSTFPPSRSAEVPPPEDNYWAPNFPSEEEWNSSSDDMGEAMDLVLERLSLCLPKKTHIFKPGNGAVDLCVRHAVM